MKGYQKLIHWGMEIIKTTHYVPYNNKKLLPKLFSALDCLWNKLLAITKFLFKLL